MVYINMSQRCEVLLCLNPLGANNVYSRVFPFYFFVKQKHLKQKLELYLTNVFIQILHMYAIFSQFGPKLNVIIKRFKYIYIF